MKPTSDLPPMRLPTSSSFLRRVAKPCIVIALLELAALTIALAFPALQAKLQSPIAYAILWALLACFAGMTVCALWRRRWISTLFHLGATLVLVGGGITAGWAKSWDVALFDSPHIGSEMRQRMIEGERVTLKSFTIETYPNGMPSQFRTELIFPEGVRELSVNHPLRRKGLTYYQMSYTSAYGPYGRIWGTVLKVRRDPGVKVTFAGYGVLILAALLMVLREVRR